MNAPTPDDTPKASDTEDREDEVTDNEPEEDTMEEETDESWMSPFFPIALLAASIGCILIWEINNASSQRDSLQQNIAQRDPLVQQAHQVQSGLEKLVLDLVDAGKDDDDAKRIIAKYNIQMGGKPALGPPAK